MKWNNIFDKLKGKHQDDSQAWRFRTSIMCNGCIAKIKPVLDEAQGIASWHIFKDTIQGMWKLGSKHWLINEIFY